MTTRHLVDPELDPILDQIPPYAFSTETLSEIRAAEAETLAQQAAEAPAFPDIEITDRGFTGPGAQYPGCLPGRGSRPVSRRKTSGRQSPAGPPSSVAYTTSTRLQVPT